MSQEHVDVIHRSFDALNRSDTEMLAALCDDDVELVSFLTAVAEGTYRGKDAVATFLSERREIWEEWRIEDAEVFEVDDERLVAVFRIVGRGKGSGVPVEHPGGATYRLRDGKLWRIRTYLDPREALEAVGLSQ